mgnify:CR=1 FL=1
MSEARRRNIAKTGSKGKPQSLSTMSEEEYQDHLVDVTNRVINEVKTRLDNKTPSPAAQEVTLRDMAAQLFLLGGAKAEDIKFLFSAKPDGSRVKGLERIVVKLLK